jgi:hypothetical protein
MYAQDWYFYQSFANMIISYSMFSWIFTKIILREMIFIANQHNPTMSRHMWHDFHSPPFTVFQFLLPTYRDSRSTLDFHWLDIGSGTVPIKCFGMYSITVILKHLIFNLLLEKERNKESKMINVINWWCDKKRKIKRK